MERYKCLRKYEKLPWKDFQSINLPFPNIGAKDFFVWLPDIVPSRFYIEKIGPSGLSCFKDMDICYVISCTSYESKGDFV